MRRLLIDSSGPYSLAAVAEDDQLLGASSARGRPAEQIHELTRKLLSVTDTSLQEIDQIAVTTGPGSWTGLNIGVTAAKVLAQVQGCTVVPVSALDALAMTHSWDRGRIWTICKAHRKRAYFSVYVTSSAGKPDLPCVESGVLGIDELQSRLRHESETPLIVEYGQPSAPLLSRSTAHDYIVRQRPWPEGMLTAAMAATPLELEETMALVPDYLQTSLAERDAKTG